MGKYAFFGAIFLLGLLVYLFTSGPLVSSPQQVTLSVGASANVGGDKAKLWFAQPDDVYTDGHIVTAAQTTLTCNGNESSVTALPGQASDVVCGVRIKLLNMTEPGANSRVSRATFEVSW
jgi:hypothetical protein